MMKQWMLAGACLAVVTIARADEATVTSLCGPLSALKDRDLYRALTHDEWIAARTIYYFAPPPPAMIPPGDRALIRPLEDGTAYVLFLDGDEACAPITLTKAGAEFLKQIKAGVVTHSPGRM